MATEEYLAFLPLLIYGIALADLFKEWKRLFDFKNVFLPYTLFTILLTELAIYNVFIYLNVVSELGEGDFKYYQYLLSLIPPFLFMLTVNIFTPEKSENTKEYFLKNQPLIFILLASFFSSHFIYDFEENMIVVGGRIIGVLLLVVLGFSKKRLSLYVPVIAWLIMFLTRISITIF